MTSSPLALLLAAAKPAGGAAIDQLIIANVMAIVASGALLWLVLGHRSGRRPYLAEAAAFTERRSGIPGWVALPSLISMISLLVALLGMYWDISLHIDVGRDPGPLANPAHYLILAGLFGIFCAGFIAMALPRERPSATALRINRGWYAPLGGVLMVATSGFALLGFPLDDFWHRLFGQDVTLWGPTHLMLIGGAAMTLIGMAVLMVEGIRARPQSGGEGRHGGLSYVRRSSLMGGFLVGLSTFQGEFDFGVPQFQMIFQPILIAFAAGTALVCARIWIGRGGALGAVAFFLLLRGSISLIVGPVFGETTPVLPLYLVEAACVEVAALWLVDRPLTLGVVAGVGIGTIGFAAEYGWTHLVYELPWNTHLLPQGPVLATIAGVAGGLAGGLMGAALCGKLPSPRVARAATAVSALALVGLFVNGLATTVPSGYGASVKLTDVKPPPDREVSAQVRIHPAEAAADAKWLNVTSWQGGGLVVDRLKAVGDGVYRTTEPIPVNGDWKATVRLQTGRSVLGLPIYFPADPAIPAPKVAAPAQFDRSFVKDQQLLQREQKKGVPGWLTTVAPLIVLAIALSLLTLLSFGLARIGRPGGRPDATQRRRMKVPVLPGTTRPA
jgi:predicted lipid-binding transport protein (Tim44 family)